MTVLPYERHHTSEKRLGLWRCSRCLAWLADSLDIAIHIGTMRASQIYPKASRCSRGVMAENIVFMCREHKVEVA